MDDTDPEKLRPADDDDVLFSLTHGLRFDGKKRVHFADDHMARIAAEHLLRHLKRSGYVVMRKPPTAAHGMVIRHYPAKE